LKHGISQLIKIMPAMVEKLVEQCFLFHILITF